MMVSAILAERLLIFFLSFLVLGSSGWFGRFNLFFSLIMAMKYNKVVVLIGSFGALAVMTVLSAIGGKVIFSLIPKFLADLIVTLLFFYFGFKLIYETYIAKEEK